MFWNRTARSTPAPDTAYSRKAADFLHVPCHKTRPSLRDVVRDVLVTVDNRLMWKGKVTKRQHKGVLCKNTSNGKVESPRPE